jgi:hypothetical protein
MGCGAKGRRRRRRCGKYPTVKAEAWIVTISLFNNLLMKYFEKATL